MVTHTSVLLLSLHMHACGSAGSAHSLLPDTVNSFLNDAPGVCSCWRHASCPQQMQSLTA